MLLSGLLTTVKLSLWSSILAVALGLVMGLAGNSSSGFNRFFSRMYVTLIRNVPSLVLIFIFYFFFGNQMMELMRVSDWAYAQNGRSAALLTFFVVKPTLYPEFLSAVITLGLYEGAYMTEIFRAGLASVKKGQWEAARVLGISGLSLYKLVIIPQALRAILPSLAGQFISTIKDSAIVSVISIQELTFQGMELMASTYLTFEVWITITVLYFMLTYSCSLLAGQVEKKLNAPHKTV